MIRLPEKYLSSMKELLRDEYEDYLESFNKERTYGLRVNTLKISVRDFLKINPFHLTPIPWTKDGFYYEEEDRPAKHPYYFAGLYYLQEPSAMYPAQALPIEEGDIVLDCCAAPGGKSTELAAKLNDSGLLVANDISVSRAQVLLKNLENQGVKNAIVMAEDISAREMFQECFDKILIDAPCSGQGMFRKESDLIRSYEEKGSEYYVPIQKRIIASAISMCKPGGSILYSTCTFSPEEDEEIIEYALDLCEDLKVMPLERFEGFSPGISEKTKECIRLYPHRIKGEGHFIALLQKGEKKEEKNKESFNEISCPIEGFRICMHNGTYQKRDDRLFFEKEKPFTLEKMRILRSGMFMGKWDHGKFNPSQALAMALRKEEYDNILDLSIDDERVLKYLKCETLDVRDRYVNGLVLVCVDSFPLGFGKVNKGILKNLYPANYRYR